MWNLESSIIWAFVKGVLIYDKNNRMLWNLSHSKTPKAINEFISASPFLKSIEMLCQTSVHGSKVNIRKMWNTFRLNWTPFENMELQIQFQFLLIFDFRGDSRCFLKRSHLAKFKWENVKQSTTQISMAIRPSKNEKRCSKVSFLLIWN